MTAAAPFQRFFIGPDLCTFKENVVMACHLPPPTQAGWRIAWWRNRWNLFVFSVICTGTKRGTTLELLTP